MTAFSDRGLVVRPGYLVGPGDTTDQFSYWPQRFARGGEILVPRKPTDPSQFVSVIHRTLRPDASLVWVDD